MAVDPVTGEPAVEHELQATSHNNFLYAERLPLFYWPVMATDLTKPNYYIDRVKFGDDRVFGTQVMFGLGSVPGAGDPRAARRNELDTGDGLVERSGLRFGDASSATSATTSSGFPDRPAASSTRGGSRSRAWTTWVRIV